MTLAWRTSLDSRIYYRRTHHEHTRPRATRPASRAPSLVAALRIKCSTLARSGGYARVARGRAREYLRRTGRSWAFARSSRRCRSPAMALQSDDLWRRTHGHSGSQAQGAESSNSIRVMVSRPGSALGFAEDPRAERLCARGDGAGRGRGAPDAEEDSLRPAAGAAWPQRGSPAARTWPPPAGTFRHACRGRRRHADKPWGDRPFEGV